MLVDVKTFLLDALFNAETVSVLDDLEQYEADYECEYRYCYSAESLNAYRSFYTIKVRVAEHTCEDGTEQTAYTVY